MTSNIMNKLLILASDCGKSESLSGAFQKYYNVKFIDGPYQSIVTEVLKQQAQCIYISNNSLKSQIIFNKFKEIRAAICYNQYMVKMCREHNDANILIIPLDSISNQVALEFPSALIDAEFDTKTTVNHQRRVNKLNLIDKIL